MIHTLTCIHVSTISKNLKCNPDLRSPTSKMLFATLVNEGKPLINDTKSSILDYAEISVQIFEITKNKITSLR